MKTLVALFGTGDAYLTLALSRAFADVYGPTRLVLKAAHAPLAELFGFESYLIDDALIRAAETDAELQREHLNDPRHADLVYAHPVFVRSGQRLDRLLVAHYPSQADMYRVQLGLTLDAPLALPQHMPTTVRAPRIALLIPEARSWPNCAPEFWSRLGQELLAAGWRVMVNDPAWPLGELLERAHSAEWVVGPQTGAMAVITAARFPCRKTFVVSRLDDHRVAGDGLRETWPFAYVHKFTGEDYDVDEYELTPLTVEETVSAVLSSRNARARSDYDPAPVTTVWAPLAPGDFLDRLAVLTVKYEAFCTLAPELAAMVDRELLRYARLRHANRWPKGTDKLYDDLVRVHEETFALLQTFVPGAASGADLDPEKHARAINLNRRRVSVRQAIDALCRAPYSEVKSYYGDQPA